MAHPVGSSSQQVTADTQAGGATDPWAATISSSGAPAWQPSTLDELDRSGRYTLGRPFARGGMGCIRRAYDHRFHRVIAVKELGRVSADGNAEKRFLREAAITARLQHPAIVPVYDLGQRQDGLPFICMKLVEGLSLDQFIKQRGSLRERLEALPYLLAVADAVAYAHDRGFIHRDLKPQNVLVGAFGETVVIDWGLAKDVRGSEEPGVAGAVDALLQPELTQDGAVVGTVAYMPLEQATGRPVDARSDVYSLGAMMYHALTGRLPYAARSPAAVLSELIEGSPPDILTTEPQLAGDLAAIVRKAMARAPDDRYPSARDLAADLRAFQAGRLIAARPYTLPALLGHYLRRYRAIVATASIFLLVLAAGGVVAFVNIRAQRNEAIAAKGEAEAARDEAQQERARADSRTAEAQAARADAEAALGGERAAREQAKKAADDALAQKTIADQQRGAAVASEAAAKEAERRATEALAGQRRATQEVEQQRSKAEANLARAEDEGRRARDANRLAVALKVLADDPTTALALLLEVEDPVHTRGWTPATVEALQRPASRAVLREHEGYVVAAEFSPDARVVATASHDGTARLSPVDGAGEAVILKGHTDALVDLAFSPDGARVATAASDGTARLWRRDGSSAALVGHRGPLTAVAFSPDGRRLATAGRDGLVMLWDVDAPGDPQRLAGHAGAVRAVAFRPDGGALVSSADDGTARVWPLAGAGAPVALRGHEGTVHAAAWSPDGAQVVTAGDDQTARVWRVADARPGATLTDAVVLRGHADAVYSAEFAPDGARVVTASRDRTARVFTLEASGRPGVMTLRGHRDKVYVARFDPAGRTVATASRDGTARLWPVDGRGEARELRGHTRPVVDVQFSRDGARVVTVAEDGTARVWDAKERAAQLVLRGHRGAVRHVNFIGPGSIVTASADRTARTWLLAPSVRATATLAGHGQDVLAAATSPDGARAFTGSADGTAKIWAVDAARPLETIDLGQPGLPHFVAFSPDRRTIATSATDVVWLVGVDGRRVALRGHQGEVRHASFDAGGARIVTASDDRTARVWRIDGAGAPVVLKGHEGSVYHAAFSPDGARVVTASWDGTARVWSARGEGSAVVLKGHEKPVRAAEFSHDGLRIVTAADDRTARIWSADGRGDTVILYGHEGPVLHAAFGPDDRSVVTGSSDQTARVWEVDFDNPVLLKSRIARTSHVCLVPEQRVALLGEEPETAAQRHRACEASDREGGGR